MANWPANVAGQLLPAVVQDVAQQEVETPLFVGAPSHFPLPLTGISKTVIRTSVKGLD